MLKKLVVILALVFGALALSPLPGEAAPVTTAASTLATEGALQPETTRWRRHSYRAYRHYRPRRSYHRRYYYPRRHYYRRHYWF